MAKRKVVNYIFQPGIPKSGNLYPNAYDLIQNNLEFLKDESVAYVADRVATDTAANNFPNAVARLDNNKEFIKDEVAAWVAQQVGANVPPYAGYGYDVLALETTIDDYITRLKNDLRYGGNENMVSFAQSYYTDGSLNIPGDGEPEVTYFEYARDLCVSYILPGVNFSNLQSVTSQDTSGGSAEPTGTTTFTSLANGFITTLDNGIINLPTLVSSPYIFAGYTYDSYKCERDMGYNINGFLNDLRYNGNQESRFNASKYWIGSTPQIDGDRQPEILVKNHIRDVINNYILTRTAYTSQQSPVVTTQYFGTAAGEAGASARITALTFIITDVIDNGLDNLPALERNEISSIKAPTKIGLEDILLITNTTRNKVLYNFADATLGAEVSYEQEEDADYPTFLQNTDTITTVFLNFDTSSFAATDEIQMFVEDKVIRTRPFDFGTDAIERMRVAPAQSMLDADFEYGLQPTKWQAIGTQRGYPSIYEIPGTDIDVDDVTTDASAGTNGIGSSLITVNTTGPHNFEPGDAFTIIGFTNGVPGTGRAQGSFVVNTIPTNRQFTYYAKAKVGVSNPTTISTTFTQLRAAGFYSGATIGRPTFSVSSNGANGNFILPIGGLAGVSIIPFQDAQLPEIGAPITGSGMATGAQITAVTGTGSTLATPEIEGDYTAGATEINVVDSAGILQNSIIDRGDGFGVAITNVSGNSLTLSSGLTSNLIGDRTTYGNIGGFNVNPAGQNFACDVFNNAGVYSITISNSGENYEVGDAIVITGDLIGGATPANDLTISVASVDTGGEILTYTLDGDAFTGSGSKTAISGTYQNGNGTGGGWDITKTNNSYSASLRNPSFTAVEGTVAGGSGSGLELDVTINNNAYSAALGGDDQSTGYVVNDVVSFAGGTFGGTTNENLFVRITGVNGTGGVTTFTTSGTAPDALESYNIGVSDYTASQSGAGATFTVTRTGTTYSATTTGLGSGFVLNETLLIAGTLLGGTSPANDCTITVDGVDGSGGIIQQTPTGTAVNSKTFLDVDSGSNLIGNGASFDVALSGTSYNTITINNAGQNYGDGQDIVIPGTALGGVSPTHDLTINIASLTTPARGVATFTNSGTGANGGTANYKVGDIIKAEGSNLGGVTGTNDALIKVASINGDSSINTFTVTGSATDAVVDYTNPNYTGGDGVGANFVVTRTGTVYSATIDPAGTGYNATNQIVVAGTDLGGTSPGNDCTITVDSVDGGGGIATITVSGTAVNVQDYTDASVTNQVGQSASFDVTLNSGTYSVGIASAGNDYGVDQTFVILGTDLFGTSPANDATITVTGVDASGGITGANISGTANQGSASTLGVTGSNRQPQGVGATFSVQRSTTASTTAYTEVIVSGTGSNYQVGDRITLQGQSLGGSSPANDVTVRVQAINTTGGILTNTHSGVAASGTGISVYSSVTISEPTSSSIAQSTQLTYSALATMQVDFETPHGLVPGDAFLVTIQSDDGNNNHLLASGPFLATSIPTLTQLQYQVRAPGTITDSAWQGFIYVRPDSFFVHRPFDGGVQLGTGGPQHGAQAIRQSKKYIRYQSGKGIMYTTGALFAPSYDLLNVTADGTSVGSTITVTTDDTDHGLQVGSRVRLIGLSTSGYNGYYTVASVVSERQFTVLAVQSLGSTVAEFEDQPQVSLSNWNGATVRSGTFDDQNGIFWQYDGGNLAAVQRTSTRQITGTVTATPDSNSITGDGTRFREQLKAGDRIVVRGMTHVVAQVNSNTQMFVTPDYRGVNVSAGVKACLVLDKVAKQSEFNLDTIDGNGPSGYNFDPGKMQMIGIQFSWYGAGFIDFMTRGSNGDFVFAHRMRNSNVNTEAFMRTGNQPVRYEVANEGPSGKLESNVNSTATELPLIDASFFPTTGGTVYVDNEIITFTGVSGDKLTGCTRAAQLTNFASGATRSYSAGPASDHFRNTGVVLISNTTSPIISHWGSAFITDGNFDEDRGYLFSYSASGLDITTTRQTVFLLRLAPSVSNALTGDLGDRDLLNRAQLLLDGLEITSDEPASGTNGQIVINGILNPQNYPVDPSDIGWTDLTGVAQGGQPSFAQIAPGGSVVWNSGTTTTTATALTTNAMTSSANHWFNLGGNRNYGYFLQNDWENKGHVVGMKVTSGQFPAGTTVTQIQDRGSYYLVYFSQRHTGLQSGQAVDFEYGGDIANSNYLFFQEASWLALGATTGTEVDFATSTEFPAGASIVSVASLAQFGATNYYRVTFNQSFQGTIAGGTAISFQFGQPPYAQPGQSIFSFVAQPGERSTLSLASIQELTNTTLGGRGTFPNGPDVLAINVYRTAGTGGVPATVTLRWSEAQA